MTHANTIKQIAELAQVSRATVSRVLNEHPSVRPEVRSRVLQVIREQDYMPQAAARSLANRRTNAIGLLIPRSAALILADPFFHQVIQGITEQCAARGYFLMLSMVTGEMEHDLYRRIVRSRPIDGLVMLSSDVDDPILPLLLRDGPPLVLVGQHPYLPVPHWVDVENREGTRQVVDHLIGLGHRRIGMITGPLDMVAGLDRRDGYKQALLEAGLPIESALIVEGDFTQEGGRLAMRRLLEQRPGAVFAANDMMALGALQTAREAGLRVPEDLALAGFDDIPVAPFANPPLTTVRQPIREIGLTAANLLIDLLEGVAAASNPA
ncbi:MAG TPA: LacI family DNA-binding transcriptional regulator, partial [Herpetosiphonaceae bacterium]